MSAWNAGDPGSIPGSGRSPGEGNGKPLQCSCLENPWREEPGGLQTGLSDFTFTFTHLTLHNALLDLVYLCLHCSFLPLPLKPSSLRPPPPRFFPLLQTCEVPNLGSSRALFPVSAVFFLYMLTWAGSLMTFVSQLKCHLLRQVP